MAKRKFTVLEIGKKTDSEDKVIFPLVERLQAGFEELQKAVHRSKKKQKLTLTISMLPDEKNVDIAYTEFTVKTPHIPFHESRVYPTEVDQDGNAISTSEAPELLFQLNLFENDSKKKPGTITLINNGGN